MDSILSGRCDVARRRLCSLWWPLLAVTVAVLLAAPASATPPVEQPHHSAAVDEALHGNTAHHEGTGATRDEQHINWWNLGCGSSDHQPAPLGIVLINFAVLLFILARFAGRPFRSFLWQRHKHVREELERATALRVQAEQYLREIETKVGRLDQEIAAIHKSVAEDADRERQAIIAAAESEAARIVETADRTLEEDLRRVRHRLEVEAVNAALTSAEKLLRQRVTDADRRRIDDEYLARLAASGGAQ